MNYAFDSRILSESVRRIVDKYALLSDPMRAGARLSIVRPDLEKHERRSAPVFNDMIDQKMQFILTVRSKKSSVLRFEISPVLGRIWHNEYLIYPLTSNARRYRPSFSSPFVPEPAPGLNYLYGQGVLSPTDNSLRGTIRYIDHIINNINTMDQQIIDRVISQSYRNDTVNLHGEFIRDLIAFDQAGVDYIEEPAKFIENISNIINHARAIFSINGRFSTSDNKLLDIISPDLPSQVSGRLRSRDEFIAQYNPQVTETSEDDVNYIADILYSEELIEKFKTRLSLNSTNLFDTKFIILANALLTSDKTNMSKYFGGQYANRETRINQDIFISSTENSYSNIIQGFSSNMPELKFLRCSISCYNNINTKLIPDVERSRVRMEIDHDFIHNDFLISAPYSMIDLNGNVMNIVGFNGRVKVKIPTTLHKRYHYPGLWNILKGSIIDLPCFTYSSNPIDRFVYTHDGDAVPIKYFEIIED